MFLVLQDMLKTNFFFEIRKIPFHKDGIFLLYYIRFVNKTLKHPASLKNN